MFQAVRSSEWPIGQRVTVISKAIGIMPARFLALLLLAAIVGLTTAEMVPAADSAGTNQTPAAAAAANQVNDPDYWVGKNISSVVKVFGEPTYWNANHDGGGGGNRYIYSKPGQPHFVFETQPGQE